MSAQQEFNCSDLYLAAFLMAEGFELVNVDKTDRKRAIFTFTDTQHRESFISDFWSKRASVEPRAFIAAIKEAKERIYSE